MVEGKTIVVTGCLQGIGRATMTKLAENGANIIACAYKQDEEFERYTRELSEKNKVEIIPVYMDMSNNEDIKRAAKEIMSLKRDLHGLVNIAGVNKDALFSMISYDNLIETFQINFFSQIIFTQYIVKIMQRRKTDGCSIVFTSSLSAIYGSPGQVSYSSSKGAIIGAVKSMSIELGEAGIRVNAVAPGVVRSAMTEALTEELISERTRQMDIPRLGEPEEVANLFMFLMSDMSKHITGQVVRIDGGM